MGSEVWYRGFGGSGPAVSSFLLAPWEDWGMGFRACIPRPQPQSLASKA